MRTLLLAAVLLPLCKPAAADTVISSTTGAFVQDDDQQTFAFTLAGPATVTMRTWSFAGGTNANGQSISAGGFAPVLSLFDGSGLLLGFDTGGVAPSGCGSRNIDPATGFCLDAYLNESLATGSYTLVLTELDNTPNGPTLADGFLEQGNGNFTGGPFLLNAGPGFQRTGDWAVDITSASLTPVPEPSAAPAAAFLSLVLIACFLRKQQV